MWLKKQQNYQKVLTNKESTKIWAFKEFQWIIVIVVGYKWKSDLHLSLFSFSSIQWVPWIVSLPRQDIFKYAISYWRTTKDQPNISKLHITKAQKIFLYSRRSLIGKRGTSILKIQMEGYRAKFIETGAVWSLILNITSEFQSNPNLEKSRPNLLGSTNYVKCRNNSSVSHLINFLLDFDMRNNVGKLDFVLKKSSKLSK